MFFSHEYTVLQTPFLENLPFPPLNGLACWLKIILLHMQGFISGSYFVPLVYMCSFMLVPQFLITKAFQ